MRVLIVVCKAALSSSRRAGCGGLGASVGVQEQLAAGNHGSQLDAGQEGAAQLAVQRVGLHDGIGRLDAP